MTVNLQLAHFYLENQLKPPSFGVRSGSAEKKFLQKERGQKRRRARRKKRREAFLKPGLEVGMREAAHSDSPLAASASGCEKKALRAS
jgi:hypothetical protein